MEKFLRANFGYGFLAADITDTDTQITLSPGHLLPTEAGTFRLVIWNNIGFPDPATDPTAEIVTGEYSNTLDTYNITRAQEGTTAYPHLADAKVAMTYTAGVSNNDFYFLGSVEIDETGIAGSRILQYNGTSGKLEYVIAPGGGNMYTSTYDPNNDGIIEDANIGSISITKIVGTYSNNNLSGDKLVDNFGKINSVLVTATGSSYTSSPTVVFSYPGRNIKNRNFDLWDAGITAAPSWWTLSGAGATVDQEATIKVTLPYSVKITRVGNDCSLYQDVSANIDLNGKNITYWKNRVVTYGAWVYSTLPNRAQVSIDDSVSTTYSSYHTGSGKWEWLSVTKTISNSATYMYAGNNVRNGNTVVYFDSCSFWDVNDGSVRATGIATVSSGGIASITVTNVGRGYEVDMHTPEINPFPTVGVQDTSGSGFAGIAYATSGLPDYKNGLNNATYYLMRDGSLKGVGYNSTYCLATGYYTRYSYVPSNAIFTDSNSAYDTTPPVPIYVAESYGSCYVLCSNGTVWGVGDNAYYQLGLNDTTQRYMFTQISQSYFGNKAIVKLKVAPTAGGQETCVWAWNSDGTLYRWGYNSYYNLGNGTSTHIQTPSSLSLSGDVPVDMTFSGGAAYNTPHILTSAGNVYMAGYNGYGVASDGTSTTYITTFKKMQTSAGANYLSNVVEISGADGGSYNVFYALRSNGTVWACGYNAQGELGDGTTTATYSGTGYIGQVKTGAGSYLTGVIKIYGYSVGSGSTCNGFAMISSGNIWTWGYNAQGEMGIGSTTQQLYAVSHGINSAKGTNTIKKFAIGKAADYTSVTFLLSNGRLLSCGYNANGHIGVGYSSGSVVTLSQSFLHRRDIANVRYMQINTGSYASLQVLTSDGNAYCCGYNGYYQLGDTSTYERYTLGVVHF